MMACGWIRGSKRLILLKSGEKLTRLRGDLAFYQATTGDYRRNKMIMTSSQDG